MSTIGFGTAAIGRPQYINIKQEGTSPFDLEKFRNHAKTMLDKAYELGIRYFDTAPGYGLSEEVLNDWLGQQTDTSIEVATKWGYTYTANFELDAKQHELKEHSIEKLKEQWEVSQHLLPYLTTYQIHSATFDTKVLENKEVLNYMAYLKTKHNILMGITVSGAEQVAILKQALDIQANGVALFDVFQVTYNIFEQDLATIANEMNRSHKRLIIKEALANGRIFPNAKFPHYQKTYLILEQLAQKYNVGVDAIALRFCIDSIKPYKVLSGAAIPEHLHQNLKANNFQLTADELDLLRSLHISSSDYWSERKKLAWN